MDATDPRRTLILILAYHGAAAHGWQRQKDAVSVQHLLEDILARIHQSDSFPVFGSSRTDVGVHARMQVVSAEVRSDIQPRNWVRLLNTELPRGIRVRQAAWGENGFRPRRMVGDKTYCYRFSFAPTDDPLDNDRVWWISQPLDRDLLVPVAQMWLGQHDFAAARHQARSQSETTIRTLTRSEIIHTGDTCEYWVSGPGFLTHQVRILAGTLIACARGQLSQADVVSAMRAKDRTMLGDTAPGRGLTLERIDMSQVKMKEQWPGD